MTYPPVSSDLTTSLVALDHRHLIHPHQTGGRPERCVFVRSKGCYIWDAAGREYLDVSGGGNWVAQVGHGRTELSEVAARQTTELAYYSSFFEFSNDKVIRLAERLAELAPEGINKVFYSNGGSEGVDSAVKIARLYHYNRGDTDRTWIIGRNQGYHGSSLGSGAVTGFPPMHQGVGPTLPHVVRVSPPYPYRAAELYRGADPTDFLIDELAATIERLGPGNVAAMIGEPILGSGGVITPPPDYWPRVRELLHDNGILLIADEVVTGYGRTGVWFDSARRGMDPDIIVTAKGLTSGYAPMGAVLMRDEIGEAIAGADAYFFHGHTYHGHPVAAAVALANLDIIENEGLVERATVIGEWFQAALAPAAQLSCVGDVRVVGAAVCLELVTDHDTKEPVMAGPAVVELRRRHGVLVRDYGPMMVLSPPLVVDQDNIVRAAEAVIDVLSEFGPNTR